MTSAVIVSTARTPLAKSWKGSFNDPRRHARWLHAVQHTVQRQHRRSAEVTADVIMGCAPTPKATGANIARQIAYAPACRHHLRHDASTASAPQACRPSRCCAAHHRGRADVFVAGGVEHLLRCSRR
ncbi:hypothetical protein GO496_10775 [Acidovorax citrulli]|nr:hypothetical protein [Paracidovorax citrulli]